MRLARIGLGGSLPRARDRTPRDAKLVLGRARGELLDRVAVSVPRREVHAAVNGTGVVPKRLLDEAHALDERAPVERAAEAERRHGVRDRDLQGGLTLVLGANRVLERAAAPQSPGHVCDELRSGRAELPRPLEEPRGERGRSRVRHDRRPAGREARERGVRPEAVRPNLEDFVRVEPEVLDESGAQEARPRPELGERERRVVVWNAVRKVSSRAASRRASLLRTSSRARASTRAAPPCSGPVSRGSSRLYEPGRSCRAPRTSASMRWKLSSSHSVAGVAGSPARTSAESRR